MAGAACLAAPFASFAQPAHRVWRIGYLLNASPDTSRPQLTALRRGLAENGLVEGKNVVVEARYAEGKLDRLPSLVADLLERKIDLMFAPSGIAAQATKKSGTTIPIVFALAPDPVGQGFAASFARPGGNMTGLTSTHTEISAKRIELLKESYPATRHVGVLYFLAPSAAGVPEQLAETARAANVLDIALSTEQAPALEDFQRAFGALKERRVDALVVIENPMFYANRARLTEIAATLRVPAVYNVSEYVHAGGLISYGASYQDLIRRACVHVARILNGAAPGDLPIERPTKFELVVNAKAARAAGVPLPASLLARADEVIDA